MQGVVVITVAAGRALRKACTPLHVTDVLDCSGNFSVGDRVYVTMRVRDGGQYAIATGVVRMDASELRMLTDKSVDAADFRVTRTASLVVVLERDIQLLWRTAS